MYARVMYIDIMYIYNIYIYDVYNLYMILPEFRKKFQIRLVYTNKK